MTKKENRTGICGTEEITNFFAKRVESKRHLPKQNKIQVALPEVQRCWSRFLMLQPDKNGNLPRTRFLQTNSSFAQREMQETCQTTLCPGITLLLGITLLAYLQLLCIQNEIIDSLAMLGKRLYQTIASCIIGKDQLRSLLRDLYPMQSHRAINELSSLFLKEVDQNNQGYISEDTFVARVQSLPKESIQSILNFPILPPNLRSEGADLSEPLSSHPRADENVQDKHKLAEIHIFRVATEIFARKRNGKLLASKLGVLETDSFRSECGHLETKDQILKMLQLWHTACQGAPSPILQAALQESGNADICNEVFHLTSGDLATVMGNRLKIRAAFEKWLEAIAVVEGRGSTPFQSNQ
ncbi:30S ribosomal protein S7, partial [Varanus komodoensis]